MFTNAGLGDQNNRQDKEKGSMARGDTGEKENELSQLGIGLHA